MAKPKEVEVSEETAGTKVPSMKLVITTALAMALLGAGAGFGLGFVSFSPASGLIEEATENSAAGEPKLGDESHKDDVDGPKEVDHGDKAVEEKSDDHEDSKGKKVDQGAAEDHGDNAPAGDGEGGHASLSNIALEPVVTNIATPSDVWIRFESVLKPSGLITKETSDQIHQDFMAFFRTLRLEDLQGASSFIALKAELLARANTRAEGKIETLYVKTFLFE